MGVTEADVPAALLEGLEELVGADQVPGLDEPPAAGDEVAAESTTEPGAEPMTYGEFGESFIRQILHTDRVMKSIDRVLGDSLSLGPIKAGPGRRFATINALAQFRPTYGHEIPGERLSYQVYLPLTADFEVDINVDLHRFRAEVLVPLILTVRVEPPLMIVWEITPPVEQHVKLDMVTDKRRSAWLQKVAGLDAELRRFLVKVVTKELNKPHVDKATHIDMFAVIDGAWPQIADQFLPTDEADRLG